MELKIEYLPLKELTPYVNNARKHGAEDIDAIVKSIKEFGFNDPIGIWHGQIVEGHGRILAAKKMGLETVPVVRLDHMTDEQRRAYALAHNKTAELSAWDFDVLDAELAGIAEIDMSAFDFDLSQLAEEKAKKAKEKAEEEPEEIEERCELGDIWSLGKHRLICGDSTDADVINRLMAGEKADMVFTDPPYALVGNSTGLGSASDDMLKPFFLAIFKNICTYTRDMMHVYVCCDWKSCNAILTESKKTELTEKTLIVWDKESAGLGAPYMSQYELIWFFENHKQRTMQAGKAEYKNRRTIKGKSNVWKFKRVQGRLHNAQKPVELVAEAIGNSSKDGEIVLDLFGGSGSTLIACEETGRRCYMCELDPHYCDVIIQRWENLTGRKAEREERRMEEVNHQADEKGGNV